jgi:hypothetical protein
VNARAYADLAGDVVELVACPEPGAAPVALAEVAFRKDAWLPAEIETLRRLFAEGAPVAAICEAIGRRPGGVQDKMLQLGLRRRCTLPWTELEDAELARRYGEVPAATLAAELGRGVPAVYVRAQLLGLARESSPPFSAWEDAQIRAGYDAGVPVSQVAVLIGRTYCAVNTRAFRLGLRHASSPPDWSAEETARALELCETGAPYTEIMAAMAAEGFPRRTKAGFGPMVRKLGYGRGWGRRWTPEEDDLLRAAYARGDSLQKFAVSLGRKVDSARHRAGEIGLQGTHPRPNGWRGEVWTPDEEARLRELYGKVKPAALGALFGRSKGAVFSRAWALGLDAGYWRPYSAEERRAFELAWANGISVSQLAMALGRKAPAVYRQCDRFGISFADPARPAASSRGRHVKRRAWTLAEILALESRPPPQSPPARLASPARPERPPDAHP